jgi:transposase
MVYLTEQQRGNIVLYMMDHPGATHQQCANYLHLQRRTVTEVLRRFRRRGTLSTLPIPGRPTTLNNEQIEWIDNYIYNHNNANSDQITDAVNEHFNINISSRTIRRLRTTLGYHSRQCGTYEPPTEQHRQQRLQWCINVFVAHNQQLNQIIFLDFLQQQLYHPYEYLENYVLYMDRASYHTANSVTAWLNGQHIEYELLPPRSPDLDPVDYIWNTFKQMIKLQQPNNEASLWNAILNVQDNIPQVAINNTINSMPHFIQSVIAKNGHIHAH